jgi:uncharacterized protein YecT (DUF1311 family)
MRWAFPLVVALLASGCGTRGHTTAGSQRIYVPQLAAVPRYKPAFVGFSVDGGNIWQIDRWINYGGPTARAIAETQSNDCTPDCATGRRKLATATILFEGRVPCEGVAAYARFRVVRSTNRSVAAVGGIQDLTHLCGYVAFTPSLPCLAHDGRAVSVAAQGRCYEKAIRITDRMIADREEAILQSLFAPKGRRSFVQSDRTWRKYRQESCAALTSEYEGGTYEPALRAACTLRLNKTRLADLASLPH